MINSKTSLFTIFSFFIFMLVFNACSDNSTGVGTDEETATINGSVAENSAGGESLTAAKAGTAYVVSAARISSNGSIETIEGTETEVDGDGRFTLAVDAETASYIVVVAENSSGSLMGYTAARVENNQSYTIKPLNAESTAETMVFANIVSEGQADVVSRSDIELAVSQGAADEIKSNSDAAAELSAAVVEAAEARAEFFAEKETDASLSLAQELKTEAHVQYEAALDAAATAEDRKEARDVFVEASVDAYAEAGVEAENIAKLIHLKTEVIKNSAGNISTEAMNSIRVSLSLYAAAALDRAMIAKAEASNSSEATVQAVADAGAELKAEIESGSGAENEINATFENYREEVRAAFENDTSAEAVVILAVDTEVNAQGGAKAEFSNKLKSLLGTSSVTEAYAEFYTAVYSSVEAAAEADAEINIEAATEIVILMNLFS
jgi:hypothetical protein